MGPRLIFLLGCTLLGCSSSAPPPPTQAPPAPVPPMSAPTAKAEPASAASPWTTSLHADHPLVGKIYRPADRAMASREAVELAAQQARFVLLGEKHDNPDHHRLQLQLLDAALSGGRRPSLVMEMLDTEVQPEIDRVLGAGGRDADAFAKAVGWSEGWDWTLYRPLVARGLERGLPFAAANLSRAAARPIVKEGTAAAVLADLTLPVLTEAQLAAIDQEIRDSHCGQLPESLVPGMALAQRARDAVMGGALRRAGAGEDGAVLIAGNGHVRADRGAPLALGAPADDVLVVSIVEVVAGEEDPAAYVEDATPDAYDFIWFTPRLDDDDPCEELRGRFGKPAG